MIQIHVDMSVDPAKEAQMLQGLSRTHFKPAAAQFAGLYRRQDREAP